MDLAALTVGRRRVVIKRPRSDTDSLTAALSHALQPDIAARAQVIAAAVRTDGAKVATQRLLA